MVALLGGLLLIASAKSLSKRVAVYHLITSGVLAIAGFLLIVLFLRRMLGTQANVVLGSLSSLVAFAVIRLGWLTDSVLLDWMVDMAFNIVTFKEGYVHLSILLVLVIVISTIVSIYFGPPTDNMRRSLQALLVIVGMTITGFSFSDISLGLFVAIVFTAVVLLRDTTPEVAIQDHHHQQQQQQEEHQQQEQDQRQQQQERVSFEQDRHLQDRFASPHGSPGRYQQLSYRGGPRGYQRHSAASTPQDQEAFIPGVRPDSMSPEEQRFHRRKCDHLRRDLSNSPNWVIRKLERNIPPEMRRSLAAFYTDKQLLSPRDYEIASDTLESIYPH